jgi:nucleotide-binding universal stress UspA family protein
MNPPDDATATVESAVRPPPLRTGPILFAYDGTPTSEYALWEAGALLGGRRALVVTVWKPGLGFELMELPRATLGLPPAQLDIRTALEIDRQVYEAAQRMAERGAALPRDAGFEVEGLAVAEEVEITIAETILRRRSRRPPRGLHGARGAPSRECRRDRRPGARLGGHRGRHRRPRQARRGLLGSTSLDIIRHAPCPVVVVRMPPEKKKP